MSFDLLCLLIVRCFYVLLYLNCAIVTDGFGEAGRPAAGDEGAVPPNATLGMTLELVSWKTISDVTKDKKVLKKALKEGEGYERPNDGAVVQGKIEDKYNKI